MKSLQFLSIALALLALPALAQPAGPVETRLESRKVTRAADGKETLVEAPTARPGEVIEYAATYRNTGKQAVKNLQATLPIPQNTELLSGSPLPGNATASLDGQSYAAMPLKRREVRDGKAVEVEIPVREYRFLRWQGGELAGGASATYTARVKVVDATGPPGKAAAK